MALNFPPTLGQPTDGSFTHEENGVIYSWDGVKWVVLSGEGIEIGSPVTLSDTAPTPAKEGDLWWCTTDGRLYVYYNDVNTSQWVDASPPGISLDADDLYLSRVNDDTADGAITFKDLTTHERGINVTGGQVNLPGGAGPTQAVTRGEVETMIDSLTPGPGVGDITSIIAGDGVNGGGSMGDVTVAVDNTVARTTGNQTIGGSKTFSSPVTVGAGTSNNHALRKSQIETLINTAVDGVTHPIITVKDFGAVGDGVADDTAAIQAAIDAAEEFIIDSGATQPNRNAFNRGLVYLPAGSYRVYSTLRVRGPGVFIKGDGQAATQIKSYVDGADLFDIKHPDQTTTGNLHNIGIADISLVGMISNPTQGAAVRVGIVKHSYFQNIRFDGFRDDLILQGTSEPVWVTDCNFFTNSSFPSPNINTAGSHIRVTSIKVDSGSVNALSGPDSSGDYYCYPASILIQGCEMRAKADTKKDAVLIEACDGCYINDCHILNQQNSVMVSRNTEVAPCANIRINNTFFDGNSPQTLRNLLISSSQDSIGGKSLVDVIANNCKFNGVGSTTGVEAWIIADDPAIRMLNCCNSYFDKALSASEAGIEILRGNGDFILSNNAFKFENGMTPNNWVRIGGNASVTVNEIFDQSIIDSNKIHYFNTVDRVDNNVRLSNNVNKVIITNNVYYGAVGGDGLVNSTGINPSSTVYGSAASNNNIDIS